MFEVNVLGVVRMCKAFIPMIRQSNGRIVNVSSIVGVVPVKCVGIYSATKFSIEAISDALRVELAEWNISISVILAGLIRSEIMRRTDEAISSKNFNDDQ